MEYRLIITKNAIADITGIYDYIAKDNTNNAGTVLERINETIETIHAFPNIGGSAKQRFGIDYKYFVVLPYTYIIFYKIIKNNLYISRIIDGRRDCIRLLIS